MGPGLERSVSVLSVYESEEQSSGLTSTFPPQALPFPSFYISTSPLSASLPQSASLPVTSESEPR